MSLVLFSELCPACRGRSPGGFCPGCRAEFERIADPCPICALPRPVGECPRKQAEWRIGRMLVPYAYAYPLSHYLQALKFKHGRRLGRALGLLLAGAAGGVLRRGTLLVPVPLHMQRLRERGYNQAFEIAQAVAADLGAATRVAGIARGGGAVPQSLLGASARRRNITGAYRVTGRFAGRHVTLVDDVVTTGATVNALAAALKAAGAVRVDALAVARTLPNRGERRRP